MIEVNHLSKNYGPFRALNDVSFRVDKGEIVGLLGANGAGKTTMMRILTGYMPPTEGQASIAGFDVFEDSLQVRKRIGYLPESVPLYAEMTVRAYLNYMADLRRVPDRKKAVSRAMESCQIAERAESLIGKLSKGLRQRVGLAQAILHAPDVLVLDEPTIGLDPKQIIQVRELIQEIGREHTVLLSSHILPEVQQTCGRVLIINRGQIVAEGTPDELTSQLQGAQRILVQVGQPTGEVSQVLEGLAGVMAVHPQREGRYEVHCTPSADCRPQLARTIVDRGWDLLELRAVDMSLEEIFIELTTDEPPATDRKEVILAREGSQSRASAIDMDRAADREEAADA
jgi:ABC-2 type transport system ATP-binding protein